VEGIRWRATSSGRGTGPDAPNRTTAGAGTELVLGQHGPHAGEKEAGQPGSLRGGGVFAGFQPMAS
jgi:hypothetical protein